MTNNKQQPPQENPNNQFSNNEPMTFAQKVEYVKSTEMTNNKQQTYTIEQIAKQNNIALYLNAKGEDNTGFSSRENSLCNAEIYISKCDNKEIQKAIFFHELGHLLQDKENYSFPHQFHYELDAWLTGLKIGYDYGYFIESNIFFELLVPSLKSYQIKGIKYKKL